MKSKQNPEIKLSIADNYIQFCISDGWQAEFMGADFPQLVDDSLTVHTPINDLTATLSFRCRKDDIMIEKDCSIKIKGSHGAPQKKPNVIPEIAQWHAYGGEFKTIKTYSCDEAMADPAKAFAEELSAITGNDIIFSDSGDVSFAVDKSLSYLGNEGYEIECTEKGIAVKAPFTTGAIWAGKTICQLMVQGGFPNGIMHDYPRYSIRGFMLDVGRKPVSMDMLKRIVNRMAWLKMNDFQIHLSDNYIWLEDYTENGDESTFNAYQAFRLESSLKNKNGETATSKDYSYTKEEFRSFIRWAKAKGVSITPEIDMPAHALAFTKAFPEYAVMGEVSSLMNKRPLTDHINVAEPEAVEFIKRIFDDYTGGENPVFPADTAVHIGADEFLSDYGAYRNFFNEIIPYIKKTNPVRLWGSLSWIRDNPETPIMEDAIKDVQMNLWSEAWADGKEMYDLGFNLINTNHRYYIVPNGTKIRAPYMDYVNKCRAFKCFEPNAVYLKNSKKYYKLPAGNKQVLGGCLAIWQDNIDKRCKGIKEQDLYDRFNDTAAVMAEKNWGSCTCKHSYKEVDKALAVIDKAVPKLKESFEEIRDITLTGKNCYVESGVARLDFGAKLNLEIEFSEVVPNTIITEADAPYGTYDIRITKNGKLGFTAEHLEYEFDYTVVPNKRLSLTIESKPLRTVLKTGLFAKKKAVGSFSFDGTERKKGIKNSSFCIPVQRIGSKTNAVKAKIYNINAE